MLTTEEQTLEHLAQRSLRSATLETYYFLSFFLFSFFLKQKMSLIILPSFKLTTVGGQRSCFRPSTDCVNLHTEFISLCPTQSGGYRIANF